MQTKVILGLVTLMFIASAQAADWPSGFSKCADEGNVCKVGSASRTVSFGIKGQFVTKVLSGNIQCTAATFGNPAGLPSTAKKCAVGPAGAASSASSTSSSSSSRSSTSSSSASSTSTGGATTIFSTTRVVKSGETFNGGGKKFGVKFSGACEDSSSPPPVFKLESGATIRDVVIAGGTAAADGIHCYGTCLLENIVWEDVCEDAATMKAGGASDVMTIKGGSAKDAHDKVFQHNGGKGSTMKIENFNLYGDIGRIAMSCGNCSNNVGPRNITADGVTVNGRIFDKAKGSVDKSYAFRINRNYGDTVTVRNLRIKGYRPGAPGICVEAQGVSGGGSTTNYGEQWDTPNCRLKTTDVKPF